MIKGKQIARSVARVLPAPVKSALRHASFPAMVSKHARFSYSQEGEDILLERIFEARPTGFYVDVGAHHPTRFSNTYLLYRRGWRGINIDAAPGSMALFRKARPRDINLELAIAAEPGTVSLKVFNDPALNTLSDARAEEVSAIDGYVVEETVLVPSNTLAAVLSEHVPDRTSIDLMTIDVEGRDFDVLKSNDWDRYRPQVLMIETLGTSLDGLVDLPEISFLRDREYQIESKLANTILLSDMNAVK